MQSRFYPSHFKATSGNTDVINII